MDSRLRPSKPASDIVEACFNLFLGCLLLIPLVRAFGIFIAATIEILLGLFCSFALIRKNIVI